MKKGKEIHRKIKSVVAMVLLLAMVCTGCAGTNNPTTGEIQEQPISNAEESKQTESQQKDESSVDKSVYMDPTKSVEERVEALLAQMTLEEKVAQMVQPEQNGISLSDITKYGVGSVLSGGGSAPSTGNDAEDWQKHINKIKQAALNSRLGIPLIYGVDAVHGHSNIYGATVFPHNIGLGAADDEDLMMRMGAIVAAEVRATGIQWTFAPTLANPQNELWGRTYEGFGEEEELVARLGAAFVKGAQGELGTEDFLADRHVVATAKHYIGEGYTVAGTNQGDVQMSAEEFDALLHDTLLIPYKAAVDAGVQTVMASFNSVNGLKCHENKYLLTDVLKGELGFEGFVVGDYNGAQQVSGANYKEQIVNCVNAGVDMLMEPYSWKDVIKHLTKAVEEGLVSQERIDDAVRRILTVKFEAGLFEEEIGGATELELLSQFGADEHREVAREAVRKSMVLLKNDEVNGKTAMEALQNSTNILVVGSKADDIGAQCGGWTISWQGSTGNITEGTTILKGLQNAAGSRNISYSADGQIDGDEDAILVVVGESPYAETSGDRSTSTLTITNDDKALLKDMEESIKDAKAKGIPVIMMLLSGRPLTIADYVDQFDAIVAAWLPGSEGDGVADVLLGEYDFTGTLTYTWPWYASDIDTKFDEEKEANILFKYGTGLTKNGTSLKAEGTVTIGLKPEKTEEEIAAIKAGSIDLESTEYVLEAENYNSNSYLVTTGNENNITFVENWGTEWANAKWDVWIPQAGNYTLHFYIAAAKDSNSVSIYYASPNITDDGNANRTVVPMTKTADMMTYEDFTLDVYLDKGSYEFKFMTDRKNGADFRLDRIWFEYK
ncbi:MAG: glycoside hydrolase family 3 C-terminal domain-containing protein [Lachnospiraceae bacterium]|nr:glycoside hydrolase family 3 C-terminal domain-containing protein [Lachnospiraceae bacterium]